MPSTTVSFAHSNTPPAALTPPSYTGTGTAPAARALPTGLGEADNTPPGGVTPPVFTGTGSAPTARAGADLTPSNIPPTGVTPPDYSGTGAAPAARALAPTTPDNSPPAARALADYAGTGAAPALLAAPDYAGTGGAPGARDLPVPTRPSENVPQRVGYMPTLSPPTDDTMHTPSLSFAGRLTAGQLFGYYKAPAAIVLKGLQLACQDAPTGADVIIEVTDSDGVGLGRTATLPAGASIADVTFGTPLPLAINTNLRLKVTQVGSTKAGSFLTATLIVQLA